MRRSSATRRAVIDTVAHARAHPLAATLTHAVAALLAALIAAWFRHVNA